MSATAVRAGRAFVELSTKNKMQKGLMAAKRSLDRFAGFATGLGAKIVGAGGAALGALAPAVVTFAKTGDMIQKMGARTGVGAQAISEYAFAAERSGTSIQTWEKGVRRMQGTIHDASRGLSTATDSLQDLNLGVDDLAGKSPDEQFALIARRLNDVQDATLKAAIAQKVFGRAGAELIPMLGDMEALGEEARRMGITFDQEAANKAAELTDALGDVKSVAKASAFAIGGALADSLITGLGLIKEIAVSAAAWVRENKRLFLMIAGGAAVVVGLGTALLAAGAAAFLVSTALSAVATVIGAIGAVIGFLLSPIGLAIGAVVALGVALVKYTDIGAQALSWFMDRWSELSAFVMSIVGGIVDAFKAGDLRLAAEIAWKGIVLAFELGKAQVMRIWVELSHLMATVFEQAVNAVKATFAKLVTAMATGYLQLKELITGDSQAVAIQAVEFMQAGIQAMLATELQSNLKALDVAKSAAVAALGSAGNQTRQELQSLLKQASTERQQAETAKAAAQTASGLQVKGGLGKTQGGLGSVVGTFSAAGAGLLGFAGAAGKDQNTGLLEAIEKNTKKNADAAGDLNSKLESA